MLLIVGLGNPGKEYENTRHNSGFRVIDELSEQSKIDFDRDGFKGTYGKGKIFDKDVILFKPLTYMNLSGDAVQEIVHYFKIDINDIIVIFDDMDTEPSKIRLREAGSAGGQKGMNSIIQNLGTENIKRIRIGIGKAPYDVVDYVLGKPKNEEKDLWEEGINKGVEALKEAIKFSFNKAMSLYNGK